MAKSKPIRVLIVDDHDVWRGALRDVLYVFDNLEFAGEASNGEEAVRMCAEVQPDVVLMDLMMPEMDGITATRAIRRICPDTSLIALTSDESLAKAAVQAGAATYMMKGMSIDALADTIRTTHQGQRKA